MPEPEKKLQPPSLLKRDGSVSIDRVGYRRNFSRDLYHFLQTSSWLTLVVVLLVVYVVANTLFALAYLTGGDCVLGARSGSFADLFFFSVHSMSTIGYGTMTPVGTYANVIVMFEAVFGLLLMALSTGIVFAKFATPRPRVGFTRNAIIADDDGKRTFMFRMANERRSHMLVEAQIRATVVFEAPAPRGSIARKLIDLPLRRSLSPLFALTWTAYHDIDETSPLHELSADDLRQRRVSVLVTMTGIDDTLSRTVHARHAYAVDDILFDMRFRDVMCVDSTGHRFLDHRRFHEVESLP